MRSPLVFLSTSEGSRRRPAGFAAAVENACSRRRRDPSSASPPQDDSPSGSGLRAARNLLHLAVGKHFGLTLILVFPDRCGNCGLAFSATGSARLQFPRRGGRGGRAMLVPATGQGTQAGDRIRKNGKFWFR